MTASPFPLGAPGADVQALTVFVRGLEIDAGIGIHGHEMGRLQTLVIDTTLELTPATVTRLSDTVNYETVSNAARAIVDSGHVGLVETFAERLAVTCLGDDRVRRVTVRIEKPGALGGSAAPGCEITLARA